MQTPSASVLYSFSTRRSFPLWFAVTRGRLAADVPSLIGLKRKLALAFFLLSIAGHWIFGWFPYLDEQEASGQHPELSGYQVEMGRDTLENWQSEFLQLLWQVGGLAFLLFVGSPQSKEGTDRLEAKVDALLKLVDPKKGKKAIRDMDLQYNGRHTDQPHAHRR